MGLPTRNLDDRTFQDIVDEAKKRIAASCPTWTDHNVSDPGITLVELFAWMAEMILYRLNQVPEKNYIKFLELIGLTLREPEPARTQVIFYLSAPQPQTITIPWGTEVATVRTEGRPSIVFSTDEDLEIRPPKLIALISREASAAARDKYTYREHNLRQLGVTGFAVDVFGSRPTPGNALYFGFENDLSYNVLGVNATCITATGMGIDIANPPWEWEVWYGSKGEERWLPAVVETDGTGGLNQSGLIQLRLPRMSERELAKQRAYWLRCRVVEPTVAGAGYDVSPRLTDVQVASWGGMVWATHASIARHESLGRSDGSPGQVFHLEHTPLLRRFQDETIQVRAEGERETWEKWGEVPDFSASGPADKHFTLDGMSGEIRFGPTLRQPDGSTRSYGAIPPRGAAIRFSSYRYGGGVNGNVQAGTLTVLKTSIPYVDRVVNPADASGGTDPETVEIAQLRAQHLLRSRGRAVTASDYEDLAALADSRVQRARCVQPLNTDSNDGPLAGQVHLLLVPRVSQSNGRITADQLQLSDDVRESVRRYLDDYRLLTVRLDIREPEYVWVAVELAITCDFDADPERVRRDAEQQLYHFLNPISGGPAGNGWPFGRPLYASDIYTCLQGIPGLLFIETLHLYLVPPAGNRQEINSKLPVPVHGLIASAEHRVTVQSAPEVPGS
jgi:predicted phage baseplate assembly protein